MCELGFELETKTTSFLKNNVDKLSNVAPERIKMETLKIVHLKWNSLVWKTYLELQLLKKWNDDNLSYIELQSKDISSKKPLIGSFLAKLIFLLDDEGLSNLTFSKNEIKRCKNLRFWVNKVNNLDIVIVINHFLMIESFDSVGQFVSDMDVNQSINILDVILMINLIFES